MNSKYEQSLPSSGVFTEVQDFYERYPYPPPVESLDEYRLIWQNQQRRRADYHLFWPYKSYSESRTILIAGCGTSQAAKHAMRWPDSVVIGIDFSATSISCTEELKRKYKLDNLQVFQLPIERVGELGMSFDQIVCTGVLHHLPDPDAGLKALRSVLKPDGALHLMVYAPYGRAGIYMLQDFCRRVGVSATDNGIADLITALKLLPPGHPLENLLREAPDFRNVAAFADALLNPQDQAYSVPQLFDFLERGGLRFGRWLSQATYSIHCGNIARIPQTSSLANLTLKDQYAAVELFRGTMIMHSVVAYRNDNLPESHELHFDGDAWLDYVPIRMSDTIAVQERLPAGAAAVLINRTHTYRDIYLPIDPIEKSIFDAIDGNLNIGAITERVLPASQLNIARTFFERLWWHDQVVFDRSF